MTELRKLEKRIATLKKSLADAPDLRPGTLGVQYRDPKERKTPFHQISYTRKGRSRSEYVRPENLPSVESELAAYRKFRDDVESIVDLSLEASRLRHAKR
jgi:hypothetical protein